MTPRVLRAGAILIAIAGLIDPVWTTAGPPLRRLIAIDLTSGASDPVVAELEARAPRWQVVQRRMSGGRLPCGANELCAAIADGSVDAEVPADVGALSLITVRPLGSSNVSLRSATAAPAHAAATGVIRIELSRSGAVAATDVRIHDGASIVGSATHRWTEGETATIDVPWWPIETGARALRIEAVPADGERPTFDNTLDLGVAVTVEPSRVLIFDARPSWSSTFVRRALEDDPRFAVEYRARVAPALSVGTAGGALDARVLEATPVVVVGSPDALTASDVALLDRYVSRRGGSLILLPERLVTGPVRRFFGDGWVEQLTPAAQAIGPLRATEILRTERPPVAATVLGRSGTAAAIVAVPIGEGRAIISGAMDAWRYRQLDSGGFDRFWRSLVAEAAAAGEALRIEFASGLAARGARMPFTLRHRSLEDRSAIAARVAARCGDAAPAPVRVWPAGGVGEFVGEVAVGEAGQCRIDATAGDRAATGFIGITERPARGVEATLARLEGESRARSGVVVAAGSEAEIAAAMDDSSVESSQIVSHHLMRSPWWIVPFALLLSIEWWHRRRGGLR